VAIVALLPSASPRTARGAADFACQRWEPRPRVDLVTHPTDVSSTLSSNLEENNSWRGKDFPESYDRRACWSFVSDVKNGDAARAPSTTTAPTTSIPGKFQEIDRPDILILEGLNVLQTGPHFDGVRLHRLLHLCRC